MWAKKAWLLKRLAPLQSNQILSTETIWRMLGGQLRNWLSPTHGRTTNIKGLAHLKGSACRRELWDTLHARGSLQKCFSRFTWTEATEAKVQGGLDTAQAWHHSPNSGFANMKKCKNFRLWWLPPRFERRAWEKRQCVAGPWSLQAALRGWCMKPARVKVKMQWRL
jgi:hypothetical protein